MRNRRYTVTIGDKTTRLLVPEFIEINGKLAMMPGDEEIIRRAVEKIYGRACSWWADSGLGLYHGQVTQPVPQRLGGGNSTVTPRVRIDIAEGW